MKDDALLVTGQAVSLRSLVADRLRLAIIKDASSLASNSASASCELTGVSRPLLREALRQLEADGLITKILDRRPVLVTLTSKEVGQLYHMRHGSSRGCVGRPIWRRYKMPSVG